MWNHHNVASASGDDALHHCKLDSHANTCCAGSNQLLIEETECKVDVQAYASSYEPIRDILIAMVATVWEDESSGHALALVTHKALFLGEWLRGSLLNPNQLHAHGCIVDDIPRQFDPSPSHSIKIPQADIQIPLMLQGICSRLMSHKPTWDKYESLPKVKLTSDTPWDPNTNVFQRREESLPPPVIAAVR